MVDYFMIRRTQLDVPELYKENGKYSYSGGWNWVAVAAFVIGVAPNVPGFLNAAFPNTFPNVGSVFKELYAYAWFIGLFIAAVVYRLGMGSHMASTQATLRQA